jgi:HAD superfamily hydrolase (TIGR01509 family)
VRLKALIFDVDGTLADTEDAHRCAFNQAFELHRLNWHWSEVEYGRLLHTAGGKERLAIYIESLALPRRWRTPLVERIPAIHETKTQLFNELIETGRVGLRDGVVRLLDEAERAGARLAIASTTTRRNIDVLLTANLGRGALERFSVIGAGDQVACKKPASAIYHFVLGQLREAATDCVAIEDSAIGVRAAKGAGLFTVATPSRWSETEDFSSADLVVSSLASLDPPFMQLQSQLIAAREWQYPKAHGG